MSEIFAEHDRDRLTRRISSITSGDLTHSQIGDLIDGDIDLVKDLPIASQQGLRALMTAAPQRGQLEKMIGPTIDYVPVAYLDLARMAANAVGRVVDTQRRAIGTGFMISPVLLMTNNHVTESVEHALTQIVQFDYELAVDGSPRRPAEFRLDPATFFWTSPKEELDCTVVAVGEAITAGTVLEAFGWLALSSAGDKHAIGDGVTVVQHPEGDFKQIAMRDSTIVGRGKKQVTLYYSADTMRGSSGSPVFNDQLQLVALHHASGFVNDDELEAGEAESEKVNEGIRISTIVEALRERHDDLPPAPRAVLAGALNPPAVTTHIEAIAQVPDPIGAEARSTGRVEADLEVPVYVSIVGARPSIVGLPATTIEDEPVVGFERNQPPDPNYENRRGYDPNFLPVAVPVPTIPSETLRSCAVPVGKRRTKSSVLVPYRHFSLVVRADRQMPLYTIVNIDGRKARKINRKTGEIEASETWYTDPRLKLDEQLDQPLFDRQRPRIFDRGHLVRRLDPAWGNPATAALAADDTFHFTNCCPQISGFNQHLWQSIENYALNNAAAEKKRITVITGPVFADDDPTYRGVAVPRLFWKVIARVKDGNLLATGFLADQSTALDEALEDGVESFADLTKVALFQRSVAEIEQLSGLTLGLRDNDTGANVPESNRVALTLDDIAWG